MRKIRIHYNDVISSSMFDAMNVSCSKAQFLFPWSQQNFFLSIKFLELFSYVQRSIRWTIIDYDNFVRRATKINKLFIK